MTTEIYSQKIQKLKEKNPKVKFDKFINSLPILKKLEFVWSYSKINKKLKTLVETEEGYQIVIDFVPGIFSSDEVLVGIMDYNNLYVLKSIKLKNLEKFFENKEYLVG